MQERYFYHSFPRRATPKEAIDKACLMLASIRDLGLLLVPEYIEWHQPTVNGQPRIFTILQKRVCFTELNPTELSEHAERFGHFALEFEIGAVRRMGAIPVFYIPQPTPDGLDALGIALLGITLDATVVIQRLSALDSILNGSMPVAEELAFSVAFARDTDQAGNFQINSSEARNFLRAVGHRVTPWNSLNVGFAAMMNFFYPADNTKHDALLQYYRQREWRIACAFAIKGVEVLRTPTPVEKLRFLEIDQTFFGRQIQTDLGVVSALDESLIHPGMDGRPLIEMARRVIVPAEAIERVSAILAPLAHPPAVVSIDELSGEST